MDDEAGGGSANLLYQELTPDRLLNAVESTGLRCDGRMLALNSYENRVYQIGIEDGVPLIVKFYRPNRWPDETILEEHAFTLELAEREIPVVAPLVDEAGRALHEFEGFRFALFPRRAGRTPELDDPDTLEWMGRFIGRIHAVGAIRPFRHRPTLNIESFGDEPFHFLMEHGFIPCELEPAYRSVAEDVLAQVRQCYAQTPGIKNIRLHGDCHAGNILWSEAGPHFVDFDDCRMGPAVQDLWMLLSGDRTAMTIQPPISSMAIANFTISIRRSCAWSKRCAPCASSTIPAGSPAAGKTRRSRWLFLGSTPNIIGRNRSSLCANRWRRWMSRR